VKRVERLERVPLQKKPGMQDMPIMLNMLEMHTGNVVLNMLRCRAPPSRLIALETGSTPDHITCFFTIQAPVCCDEKAPLAGSCLQATVVQVPSQKASAHQDPCSETFCFPQVQSVSSQIWDQLPVPTARQHKHTKPLGNTQAFTIPRPKRSRNKRSRVWNKRLQDNCDGRNRTLTWCASHSWC
jgi:hypothetical protein